MLDVVIQAWEGAFAFSTSWPKLNLGQIAESLPVDWVSDVAEVWLLYTVKIHFLRKGAASLAAGWKAMSSSEWCEASCFKSWWRSSPCMSVEPGKGRGALCSQEHSVLVISCQSGIPVTLAKCLRSGSWQKHNLHNYHGYNDLVCAKQKFYLGFIFMSMIK